MWDAIKAGIVYWAFVFGLGFILGTVRTLWIAPLLDSETMAVFLELPFMLLASWFGAYYLVGKLVVRSWQNRFLMGVLAFGLVLMSEAYLGVLLMGESITDWIHSLFAVPGIAGLASQILFAIFPMLVQRSPSAVKD